MSEGCVALAESSQSGQERLVASTFDEEWYLRRYPDVAEAIARGDIRSASAHYERYGRREGRQPHDGTIIDSDNDKKLMALRLPDLTGKSFLEIGCNDGFFCHYAKRMGASRVVGIDVVADSVEKAKALDPGIEFLCQSLDTLPNGPFDVILSSSVLHRAPDPHRHIRRIHQTLAGDGLFILECAIAPFSHSLETGVYELGGAFWERELDAVCHPSEALLRSNLLADFSVRAAGNSVSPEGDSFPRRVFHCRKFRPIVLLVGGAGDVGKTTFAVELQRYGVPTFSSDFALQLLATNRGSNTGPLWSLLKNEFDSNLAIPAYQRLNEPHMAALFATEIVAMMPKFQRFLVLEGYAFGLDHIREKTLELLRAEGYVVHCAVL